METNEPDVKRCGRDQQLFAMNLMMELSSDSMVRLKTEFQSREIQMADFIMLMEEYLPNMYFDENCIRNLVNLFEEIDVNGDGGMEWDEFTQFIIESAFTVQSGNCGQKIYNFIADVQMTDRISFMSYSPITRRLYCAEEHTNNNGTHISTITGHTGTVTSCVYIPQWRVLATASLDQTIALWDEDSGFCICFQTSALEKEDPHVQMVLYWDQNHEMLFSGGINGRINIFTITNNEKWKIVNSGILPEDKVLLKKRLDVLRSVQIGNLTEKQSQSQLDVTMNLPDEQLEQKYKKIEYMFRLSLPGVVSKTIVDKRKKRDYQLQKEEEAKQPKKTRNLKIVMNNIEEQVRREERALTPQQPPISPFQLSNQFPTLDFTERGRILRQSGKINNDKQQQVDARSNELSLQQLQRRASKLSQLWTSVQGHFDLITAIVDIPGTTHLIASSSNDGNILVWDVKRKMVRTQLKKHTNAVTSLLWHNTGKVLISGGSDSRIVVWNPLLSRNQYSFQLTSHKGIINSLNEIPNTMQFLSMSRDGVIKMWDLRNGIVIQILSLDMFSGLNVPLPNQVNYAQGSDQNNETAAQKPKAGGRKQFISKQMMIALGLKEYSSSIVCDNMSCRMIVASHRLHYFDYFVPVKKSGLMNEGPNDNEEDNASNEEDKEKEKEIQERKLDREKRRKELQARLCKSGVIQYDFQYKDEKPDKKSDEVQQKDGFPLPGTYVGSNRLKAKEEYRLNISRRGRMKYPNSTMRLDLNTHGLGRSAMRKSAKFDQQQKEAGIKQVIMTQGEIKEFNPLKPVGYGIPTSQINNKGDINYNVQAQFIESDSAPKRKKIELAELLGRSKKQILENSLTVHAVAVTLQKKVATARPIRCAIYNELVTTFAVCTDNIVRLFDAYTGQMNGEYEMDANITAADIDIRMRKLYIGTVDGKVYAYKFNNGAKMKDLAWHHPFQLKEQQEEEQDDNETSIVKVTTVKTQESPRQLASKQSIRNYDTQETKKQNVKDENNPGTSDIHEIADKTGDLKRKVEQDQIMQKTQTIKKNQLKAGANSPSSQNLVLDNTDSYLIEKKTTQKQKSSINQFGEDILKGLQGDQIPGAIISQQKLPQVSQVQQVDVDNENKVIIESKEIPKPRMVVIEGNKPMTEYLPFSPRTLEISPRSMILSKSIPSVTKEIVSKLKVYVDTGHLGTGDAHLDELQALKEQDQYSIISQLHTSEAEEREKAATRLLFSSGMGAVGTAISNSDNSQFKIGKDAWKETVPITCLSYIDSKGLCFSVSWDRKAIMTSDTADIEKQVIPQTGDLYACTHSDSEEFQAIVTGSSDGSIRVFDSATIQQISTFQVENPVQSLCMLGNYPVVCAGDSKGMVHLFTCKPCSQRTIVAQWHNIVIPSQPIFPNQVPPPEIIQETGISKMAFIENYVLGGNDRRDQEKEEEEEKERLRVEQENKAKQQLIDEENAKNAKNQQNNNFFGNFNRKKLINKQSNQQNNAQNDTEKKNIKQAAIKNQKYKDISDDNLNELFSCSSESEDTSKADEGSSNSSDQIMEKSKQMSKSSKGMPTLEDAIENLEKKNDSSLDYIDEIYKDEYMSKNVQNKKGRKQSFFDDFDEDLGFSRNEKQQNAKGEKQQKQKLSDSIQSNSKQSSNNENMNKISDQKLTDTRVGSSRKKTALNNNSKLNENENEQNEKDNMFQRPVILSQNSSLISKGNYIQPPNVGLLKINDAIAVQQQNADNTSPMVSPFVVTPTKFAQRLMHQPIIIGSNGNKTEVFRKIGPALISKLTSQEKQLYVMSDIGRQMKIPHQETGNLLVVGDDAGYITIYDVSPILFEAGIKKIDEWMSNKKKSLAAQQADKETSSRKKKADKQNSFTIQNDGKSKTDDAIGLTFNIQVPQQIILDSRTRSKMLIGRWRAHKSGITSVSYIQANEAILTSSTDGTACIWSLQRFILKDSNFKDRSAVPLGRLHSNLGAIELPTSEDTYGWTQYKAFQNGNRRFAAPRQSTLNLTTLRKKSIFGQSLISNSSTSEMKQQNSIETDSLYSSTNLNSTKNSSNDLGNINNNSQNPQSIVNDNKKKYPNFSSKLKERQSFLITKEKQNSADIANNANKTQVSPQSVEDNDNTSETSSVTVFSQKVDESQSRTQLQHGTTMHTVGKVAYGTIILRDGTSQSGLQNLGTKTLPPPAKQLIVQLNKQKSAPNQVKRDSFLEQLANNSSRQLEMNLNSSGVGSEAVIKNEENKSDPENSTEIWKFKPNVRTHEEEVNQKVAIIMGKVGPIVYAKRNNRGDTIGCNMGANLIVDQTEEYNSNLQIEMKQQYDRLTVKTIQKYKGGVKITAQGPDEVWKRGEMTERKLKGYQDLLTKLEHTAIANGLSGGDDEIIDLINQSNYFQNKPLTRMGTNIAIVRQPSHEHISEREISANNETLSEKNISHINQQTHQDTDINKDKQLNSFFITQDGQKDDFGMTLKRSFQLSTQQSNLSPEGKQLSRKGSSWSNQFDDIIQESNTVEAAAQAAIRVATGQLRVEYKPILGRLFSATRMAVDSLLPEPADSPSFSFALSRPISQSSMTDSYAMFGRSQSQIHMRNDYRQQRSSTPQSGYQRGMSRPSSQIGSIYGFGKQNETGNSLYQGSFYQKDKRAAIRPMTSASISIMRRRAKINHHMFGLLNKSPTRNQQQDTIDISEQIDQRVADVIRPQTALGDKRLVNWDPGVSHVTQLKQERQRIIQSTNTILKKSAKYQEQVEQRKRSISANPERMSRGIGLLSRSSNTAQQKRNQAANRYNINESQDDTELEKDDIEIIQIANEESK